MNSEDCPREGREASIGGEDPSDPVRFIGHRQGEGEQEPRLLRIEVVGGQNAECLRFRAVEGYAASGARREHDHDAGLDRVLDGFGSPGVTMAGAKAATTIPFAPAAVKARIAVPSDPA